MEKPEMNRRTFLKSAVAAGALVPNSLEAKLSPADEEVIPGVEVIPVNESVLRTFIDDYVWALNQIHGKEMYTYEGTVILYDKDSEFMPDTLSIIICHGLDTGGGTQFWIGLNDEVRSAGIPKDWIKEQIDQHLREEGAIE